jgi:hypothetical protein
VALVERGEAKTIAAVVRELSGAYEDLIQAMKGTVEATEAVKRLRRSENRSRLIKVGLTLIAFPEPTVVGDVVGSVLVAAGAVQQGIRKRSMYVEDVSKSFHETLKGIRDVSVSFS